MKILIPHIGYTLIIKKRSAYKEPHPASYLCEKTNTNTTTLFIDLPLERKNYASLAHELVHVLQNICIDRHMVFENETEHMAYIMQFLWNKIMGFEYDV